MSYDFIEFCQDRGLLIDSLKHGRIVRVKTEGHSRKLNGAYSFHGDFGWAQNWGIMEKPDVWIDKKERSPFQQEDLQKRMEALKANEDAERKKRNDNAAFKAMNLLHSSYLDRHAYMDKKGMPDTLVNVIRNGEEPPIMVVPMYIQDRICGIQLINIDGGKKFIYGSKTKGAYFKIGVGDGQIFLVEGYASGMSLQACLDALKVRYTIYITFSANNMAELAKQFPQAILICDADISGTGQKVGAQSGCRYWHPEVEGMDINDVYKSKGLFQTSLILRKVLTQLKK